MDESCAHAYKCNTPLHGPDCSSRSRCVTQPGAPTVAPPFMQLIVKLPSYSLALPILTSPDINSTTWRSHSDIIPLMSVKNLQGNQVIRRRQPAGRLAPLLARPAPPPPNSGQPAAFGLIVAVFQPPPPGGVPGLSCGFVCVSCGSGPLPGRRKPAVDVASPVPGWRHRFPSGVCLCWSRHVVTPSSLIQGAPGPSSSYI